MQAECPASDGGIPPSVRMGPGGVQRGTQGRVLHGDRGTERAQDWTGQQTIVFRRLHPHDGYAAIWDPSGHLTTLEIAECITKHDAPKDKKWEVDSCAFWLIWGH